MYRKIDIYLNKEYVCSTNKFPTCKAAVQRIRADQKIFVANDKMYYVCEYDNLRAVYSK